MVSTKSVLLVAPSDKAAQNLADRLKMQGYVVDVAASAAEAARSALLDPPAAIVADLWMPGISGVQLCRLLRSEASTDGVPIILRGPESQRNRYWAERAGAAAYVAHGRMGALVRSLSAAIASAPPATGFFTDLGDGNVDIRDRIASLLDAALFDSVIAAEVRALGTACSFERLFDLLSQLVARLSPYRWLALSTLHPVYFGLHANPANREASLAAASTALSVRGTVLPLIVEDADAFEEEVGPAPIVVPIKFGDTLLGHLAIAPRVAHASEDKTVVTVVAREIGGPLRVAMLVEESRLLATTDALTGLRNRRAFIEAFALELAHGERHGYPVSVLLVDVDHFKLVNDRHGHAAGDAVLAAVAHAMAETVRQVDVVARWGGEEFVVALSGAIGAELVAERVRCVVAALETPVGSAGSPLRVTISVGVATHQRGETLESVIDRADRAMYAAKTMGRNRVVVDTAPPSGVDVGEAESDLSSGRWRSAEVSRVDARGA